MQHIFSLFQVISVSLEFTSDSHSKSTSLVAHWQRIHLPMQETWIFDTWAGKVPWRRKWQPTPAFLPGEPHGQSSQWATIHGVANSWTWLRWLSTHIAQHSAFKWVYLSFSPLLFASLLFAAICKASSDSHFAFLHFFFLGMVLISVSCTMSWTSQVMNSPGW